MRYVLVFLPLGFPGYALSAPVGERPASSGGQARVESQPGAAIVVTANNDKEDLGDGARIICRRAEVTGSRTNIKTVCATATEWAAQKAQNRQAIEQAQNKKWSAAD